LNTFPSGIILLKPELEQTGEEIMCSAAAAAIKTAWKHQYWIQLELLSLVSCQSEDAKNDLPQLRINKYVKCM
jgi:hypothetical protein